MYQGIITIKDKQWQVDIATTSQELNQGLGGVSSIPSGTGMLFDLGYTRLLSVTTHPMLFNIDIAFISDEFVITQIARDVPPGMIITPDNPMHFFLEVNANELDGIEIGDEVFIYVLELQPPISQTSYLDYVVPIIAIGMLGTVVIGFAKPASKTKYYTDTAEDVDKRGYYFQTQLDDVFVEAIKRARKLYG